MTDLMESNSSTEAALAILSARRRRTELRGIVYRNLRWHPDIQPIVDAIERGEAFEAATGETYTTVWKGMGGWASGITLDDLKFVLEALRQRRARLSEREQQLAEEIINGTPSPPTFDETEDFDRAEPDTDTAEPWEQPLSTHPIPFGAIRSHNGRTWRSRHPFNVWEPGAPGVDSRIWEEVVESEGPEPTVPDWKPWDGHNSSLHQVGSEVMHNGQHWVSTAGDNHWEPGVHGWVVKT